MSHSPQGKLRIQGRSRQDAPTDEIWIFREDALIILCPWFFLRVFYTVTSFNEASGDNGFPCFMVFMLFREFLFFVLIYNVRDSVRGEVSDLDVRNGSGGVANMSHRLLTNWLEYSRTRMNGML